MGLEKCQKRWIYSASDVECLSKGVSKILLRVWLWKWILLQATMISFKSMGTIVILIYRSCLRCHSSTLCDFLNLQSNIYGVVLDISHTLLTETLIKFGYLRTHFLVKIHQIFDAGLKYPFFPRKFSKSTDDSTSASLKNLLSPLRFKWPFYVPRICEYVFSL